MSLGKWNIYFNCLVFVWGGIWRLWEDVPFRIHILRTVLLGGAGRGDGWCLLTSVPLLTVRGSSDTCGQMTHSLCTCFIWCCKIMCSVTCLCN